MGLSGLSPSKNVEDSGMWPRDYSCYILMKNVAAFCPCPKILPEAKLKSFGLMALTETTLKTA